MIPAIHGKTLAEVQKILKHFGYSLQNEDTETVLDNQITEQKWRSGSKWATVAINGSPRGRTVRLWLSDVTEYDSNAKRLVINNEAVEGALNGTTE